ncbi:MAG: knotted carbamoyltransferase YgeW [Ignavibacteriales bacterium]|nr:knotted carbamoyltransferase YgeW [Ignavibacteriales bacterium]
MLNVIQNNLELLKQLHTDMYNRDFLLTWERTDDEIKAVLTVAQLMIDLHKAGISFRAFDTGLAISIFRDNSTRTRFSFASAANALGLGLSELDEEKSQIAHGETVRETANMISFLAEVVGIRDDMFLGEGNKYMREFGAAIQEGYEQGILHQRPSIVNLQCDIDHPTQALADLMQLKNTYGSLENLRGKKIAMTWAYSPSYGKPLSVPQSIIGLMSRFGMDVSLAYPEGYGLIPEVAELAKKQSVEHGSKFEVVNSMDDAFQNADIVYPKSWAPYHVMQKRTVLLSSNDKPGLKELEKECLANNAKFKNWECDEQKMKLTKNGKALYMHCLPADISGVSCTEGEVSKNVFEKYRLATYAEASYKPFVIAAIMFLMRMQNPEEKLQAIVTRNQKRSV